MKWFFKPSSSVGDKRPSAGMPNEVSLHDQFTQSPLNRPKAKLGLGGQLEFWWKLGAWVELTTFNRGGYSRAKVFVLGHAPRGTQESRSGKIDFGGHFRLLVTTSLNFEEHLA